MNCQSNSIQEKTSQLYGIEEILRIYPLLSKHLITNAINKNDLKSYWIGNKRYFYLSDIEDYINSNKMQSKNKEEIESWRTN